MSKTKEEKQAWWNNLSLQEQEVYSKAANRRWWDALSVKQQNWIKWDTTKKQQEWVKKMKHGQK